MRYYLIVGEASGDLHASELMKQLAAIDPEATFRFFGGDLMQAQGGECVMHYKSLAYMGFIPVLLHLGTILGGLRRCKRDILAWKPDMVILVDSPGFNLKIAHFVRSHTQIPVCYYISPKIWAWKEYRIKNIRRDVDLLLSILPFEKPFFEEKHHYPITYVGNPTMDEVTAFKENYRESREDFFHRMGLEDKPTIALLAGSRKQEVKDNLPLMLEAVDAFVYHQGYQAVVACAPGIEHSFYESIVKDYPVQLVHGSTYPLLAHSMTAMVTSGTATLETALFGVPQVVCYYTPCGWLVSWLRRHLLRVPFISLVNLIAGYKVVSELVAHSMKLSFLCFELQRLLNSDSHRQKIQEGYAEVVRRLGPAGCPRHAAEAIVQWLKR